MLLTGDAGTIVTREPGGSASGSHEGGTNREEEVRSCAH
jgi:hypothetical protein